MNLLQPMLDFFGLREQPFAPTADPAYFYATPQHREALFRVWTAVEGGFGPVVVLSTPGMGKTLLLRKILTHMALEPERYNAGVIASPSPAWTALSLLETMMDRFGVPSNGDSFSAQLEAFSQYLLEEPERTNILIIDDAQNLTQRGQIELLRMTQNLETPHRKLLNVVVFAQTSWMSTLQEAENFTQRASAVVVLKPLRLEELQRIVEFRLRQAGAEDPASVFTPEALRIIHEQSRGIPRIALTLCRNALIVAGLAKTRPIGRDAIEYTVERTLMTEVEPEPVPVPANDAPAPANMERGEYEPERAEPESDEYSSLPAAGMRRPLRPHEEQANELLLRAARQRPV